MTGAALEIKPIHIEEALLLSAVATCAYSDHYLNLWHDGGQWYLETYLSIACLEEELRHANARFFFYCL